MTSSRPGGWGILAVRVPGDRYLGLEDALAGADIVHAQELGYWYSMQAAKLKRVLGFRLVLTVWETIPLLDAYRNVRTRRYRAITLAGTDLFLAATERARAALLLEGAAEERIRVCPPGIDVERFAGSGEEAGGERAPLVLSAGRLVWEKGHQDVLRAVAMLRRGLDGGEPLAARVLIVGSGPEEGRLRSYAAELGLGGAVEFRGFVPYEEMPSVYRRASCLVLGSLATWSWEEQFGMVLAEGMAAGVAILASSSGAIPEVTGEAARHFRAGDWVGLAGLLRRTLTEPSGSAGKRDARYSTAAAAAGIAAAYGEVLAGAG